MLVNKNNMITIVCLLIISSESFAQDISTSNEKRVVISLRQEVYFDNIFFDFKYHLNKINSHDYNLIDCSTTDYFCFENDIFQLKLPTDCNYPDKHIPALGTVILGKISEVFGGYGAAPIAVYLVINPKYPFIVYEYSPAFGITGVSFEKNFWEDGLGKQNPGRIDFASLIKQGLYKERRGRDWSWSRRQSVEPFAACAASTTVIQDGANLRWPARQPVTGNSTLP